MSWWIGYAELFFTKKRCPELDIPTYQEAIIWFNQMAEKRNF
jgi:undecaprenyl pyrophosphate synthase